MPIRMKIQEPYIYNIEMQGGRTVETDMHFFAKLLKDVNKGFSPMVLIVGRQRMGKSFVGVLLSSMIMKALSKDSDFNPVEQCFYEPLDMIKAIGDLSLSPIMLDEAGATMGRREWYEQVHRALEKCIQTQGYKTLVYIFVSPFGTDIDRVFVKHFDFIVRVDYRGKFKVFKTIKHYDELNRYVIRKYFLDDVRYSLGDLQADVWKAYEKFSFQEKERLRIKYSTRQDKQDKAANTVISQLKSALRRAG